MRKRIVSLVLILCMCIPLISVMPVSADYTLSVNDDVLWGVGKTIEEIKTKYGNDFDAVYNRNEETGEEDILTLIYSTSKLVGAGIEVGSIIVYNTHNNVCFEAIITLNAIILEGAKDYYNMDTLSLDTLEKLFGKCTIIPKEDGYNDLYTFNYSGCTLSFHHSGSKKLISSHQTVFVKGNYGKEKEKPISIYLNNNEIEFDQPPIMEDGRTLVPVRAIFEKMGMTVNWDNNTSTVTAIGNNNVISMVIDNSIATVNGNKYYLDVPAKIINGRTFVPVRFVSENLDCFVEWNGEEQTINILDRVHFFTMKNATPIKSLLSHNHTYDTWYDYYMDSIQNNKAKWASAKILKFWSDPFSYWSETDSQKITTAVLIDALTNETAISSMNDMANEALVKNMSEDLELLIGALSDRTEYESDEIIGEQLKSLQQAKQIIYTNSNKDISNMTPKEISGFSKLNNEIADTEYAKIQYDKLNKALTKMGIAFDVANLANVGYSQYNTIMTLISVKEDYINGLDLIAEQLPQNNSTIILRKSIEEVKEIMNQSMIESISDCVNNVAIEFMDTSIAKVIRDEFILKSLRSCAEKFLLKIGVSASTTISLISGIGQAANVVGSAVTAGQITTAACDILLGTGNGIDASYDLRMLMDIKQNISTILTQYINDLINEKNVIVEITSITAVLKPIMIQASFLTNQIYNADHNSLIDKGFRLIFTDKDAYDDTYDRLYQAEIDRIANIKFINY